MRPPGGLWRSREEFCVKLSRMRAAPASHRRPLSTTKGMVIRSPVKQIRVMGRVTQGVHIVKLKEGDKVADIVKVEEIVEEV